MILALGNCMMMARAASVQEVFPAELDGALARFAHGDELYVDIGNFRRGVTLPLALSDLNVGVARMREGMLEIPFQPHA